MSALINSGGGAIKWPEVLSTGQLTGIVLRPERPTIFGHAARYDHGLPAIVAWLAKPQLLAAIDAEIDAQSAMPRR